MAESRLPDPKDKDWDVVEGWLHIWDVDHELERRVFGGNRRFQPRWQPIFLLVLVQSRTLTFYHSEEDAREDEENEAAQEDGGAVGPAPVDMRLRLDGGKDAFDRRWGYEWLEPIREIKSPEIKTPDIKSPGLYSYDASAESFFKSRTFLDEMSGGSLSDLQSPDSEPPRTPALLRRFIKDSSLDRADGERRGSLPLVTGLHDSMESVSTTSRLANFFSKKGFRSNLKRTKSVTKLDRKQSIPNLSSDGQDSSSLMGSLKRTMSLGRLARKKKSKRDKENHHNHDQHNQQHQQQQHHHHLQQQQQRRASSTASSKSNLINTPHSSPALSLISARIRSSRSHESLLTSSHPSMHSINLSDPDVEVKPLHSSVLGQGHCFHVATSQGSKYVSCTTSEERDKWMYSLRRTARPNEEHCRRSDSSLKLWVVEAKNLSVKKRYYCNILLDKTLYAQTSIKTMTDMLFWGEHFEFKSLPVVETVTINLFREADKKKKKDKDMLVGYIKLAVEDLENRQLIEKWITCNSGTVGKAGKETKSELPIIRIKARKQKVDILPLDTYQSFIKFLTTDYLSICSMLESVLVVREKEEFATSLVHILQTQGKACQFLSDIVMDEIDRLDDEHLTFRGNSIATKAMEAYMKLVGEKYLQDTLGEFIRSLIKTPEDCEVDPTKVATPQLLECQQSNLEMYCDMVWVKVINSFCYFPNEMREVFSNLRTQCAARGKTDYSDNLISGCIFLRFLCPAILYPNLFHLIQEYPQEKASRNLTLIAKTIQTLANFTQFGTKEEFMTFMNKFVEREEENMKSFLHKISSQDAGNEFLQYDGDIDLGKELSVLHCLLTECRDKYAQTSGDKFEHINNFINTLSSAFNDPTIGQRKPHRKSQIYDNMMNIPVTNKQPTSLPIDIQQVRSQLKHVEPNASKIEKSTMPSSPTELLRNMLRHCGESMDDLPALAEAGKNSNTNTNTIGSTRERASSDLTARTSRSRSRSYSGENGLKGAALANAAVGIDLSTIKVRPLVSDVSAGAGTGVDYNQDRINESWIQMVNAADSLNGDYIDLIAFKEEDANDESLEVDANITTGSQASIGQSSTIASSGYQSFSHSQSHSNSPVDPSSNSTGAAPVPSQSQSPESTLELAKSPVIQYNPPHPIQPLAFANPLFSHQQKQKKQNGGPQQYSNLQQYRQQPHRQPQPPQFRPPMSKSTTLGTNPGYAGSIPLAPAPKQRHAKTVQRKSSDSSNSSDEDNTDNVRGGSESRHKRRGYKPLLRTTTNVTATTTTDYQTSIAPLKKLSQLSSSSSDEDTPTGVSLGFQKNVTVPFSPNSTSRQYSSMNTSSSSNSHFNTNPSSLSSSSSSSSSAASQNQQPVSNPSSSSLSSTFSSASSYQTTFSPTNSNSSDGYSTFPRKHARNAYKFQEPSENSSSNNNVSPPLPPREAITPSTGSPAVPPKSSSRTAFLQRQFSQQTYSSNTIGRPTYPPRNTSGITTTKTGHVQIRNASSSASSSTSSSSISSSQWQHQHSALQHSTSIDGGIASGGGKYMTTPRPVVSRKPQKLPQPNQNSVETAIDCVDICNYHQTQSQRLSNKIGAQMADLDVNTTAISVANSNMVNNNNNNDLIINNPTKASNGGTMTVTASTAISTSSSTPAWQVARHMERSSSSHDTTSSSSESSPQSLVRSSHHQNHSSSMQDSSSAHSISSAPTSSQAWGTTTPSQSDSSSSLSSLTHPPNHHLQNMMAPNRSDSSGSLGGVSGNGVTPGHSGSIGSISSVNNNSATRNTPLDNGNTPRQSFSHRTTTNPPPNSPNTFASRLSSRSDGQINTISLQAQNQPHSITSSFSIANPIPLSSSPSDSPTTPNRSLSYHSPTSSPNLSHARSSYPASRSMDLSSLTKKPSAGDVIKRTSVDSLLSQTDNLSPTGSLSRDDLDGRSSSSSSTTNRRLSPQSAVHMGISSVQRKLQEQERTKKEYETEVHTLRQQLLEAQERLQQAEMRLLDHEVDTHQLMDQWQSRLVESEEKMRKQQEEKDEKMKEIITRLQSIEDELKKEQEEMAEAVEQKQQVIEVQEQRIRHLDLANQKLLMALAELKGRAIATQKQALASGTKGTDLALEMAGFKTSSC